MKVCRTCQIITDDGQSYCAHDGHLLFADPLATALQESIRAKYSLSGLIGTGSMGAVYRAQHHALGDVAIKVMLGPPDNHKLSERFLREAKALRKLNNPHSVLVYDLERSPTGLTYMVMEMVEGRSLRYELKQRGSLSLEETIDVAEAVCDALEAAHEHGIIHRDLKPDNILLAEEIEADGDVSRLVKIVDFGIVKLRGTKQGDEEAAMQLTKYGSPIGTPFYMSPEQWFGDGPGFTALDGRTDIYSLGCTLYEMLSGYPPFVAQTKEEMRNKHLNDPPRPLNEIAPHVPEPFSRLILRALEKDRDLRPSSAAEFASELRRAYDESVGATTDVEGVRAGAKSAVSAEGRATSELIAQLQTTEESFPVIREWAAEEAQDVIQQVLEGHPANPHIDEQVVAVRSGSNPAVEQPPAQHTPDSAGRVSTESTSEMRELMVATSGVWSIGLFADEAENVSTWRTPVPLPHAPPAVLGVVSVRGRMLIVLDPAALLGDNHDVEASISPNFIISLRGDEHLALAVNRVERTIEIQPDEIEALAQGVGASITRGLIRGENGQIIVLDTRELFAAATQGAERRRQRSS